MATTREKLLKRVFKDYLRFFYYENQVAFFEGRNFEIIYAFYDTLSTLRSRDTELKDWMEKVNLLSELVDDFITCSNMTYPFILQNKDNSSLEKIQYNEIIEKFNDASSEYFDRFYIAYTLMQNYKKVDLIEELLIEFNNYMSHFVSYILNDKLSNGISHLYRACLDGYKDIILENNVILLSNIELRNEFINLRIKECSNIGVNENNKLFILEEYQEIATNIVTLYNCNVEN